MCVKVHTTAVEYRVRYNIFWYQLKNPLKSSSATKLLGENRYLKK